MAEPIAEIQGTGIPDGWFVPAEDHAREFEKQLAREVRPGNPAYGHVLVAALKSDHNDDVLFVERTDAGPVFWLIHLTWATSVNSCWPMAVRIDFPADLVDDPS